MYEHGEEQMSDEELRQAMIIAADPEEYVERINQVEELGAPTVALMNAIPPGVESEVGGGR